MVFKRLSTMTIVLMLVVSAFSGYLGTGGAVMANSIQSGSAPENDKYEIYPLPQNEIYLGTNFNITDEVNIVIEETIDESTINLLHKILESKSIQANQSEEMVSDQTNVIIGTRESNGYVDTYFKEHIEYDEAIFNEIDPYVLRIDKKLEEKGTIAILGADTDAAYYALATLQMIFEQIPKKHIQSVMYEDYADAKWRGFIEGFYGFPWSHEARMSLMHFGGKFKMNSYIFGPKDDQYHNSAWRTPYPDEELAEIKELVDAGIESKTHFIWAIHPGMDMIKWDDYETELGKLLTKFEQMYGVGVRQFGLFMDDINRDQALADTDRHVRLITDIANWVNEKENVKPLIYTPPFYNENWAKPNNYLERLKEVPENVEIMYTGKCVVCSVNEKDMQFPKDRHGRDPYVWLNWPVNDYSEGRLMLGKGEMLQQGTHNISGIVTNPMGKAELSKISLFAIADFAWNVDAFDDEQSWLDSFKYIAPEVADEFNTIAYHLSDPSPNQHNFVLAESENIGDELELFLTMFDKGESVEKVGNQLIIEFDRILDAINIFREKNPNQPMVEEIEPWLDSLHYVVKADKHAVKAAIAQQNGNIASAWEEFTKATSAMEENQKITVESLNRGGGISRVPVEAGPKRLVPFANELIETLDAHIYTEIAANNADRGDVGVYTNVNELGGTPVEVKSVSNVLAKIAGINNITLQPSQYIGIKFPSIEQILDIKLESTQSDLVLEVSENNIEWKEVVLGDPYPNAAYVRVINKSDQAVTFNLTKLSIEMENDKSTEPVVSHNYKDIREGNLQELYEGKLGNSKVWFNEAQHVGKYVQIDMGDVVDVHNVAVVIDEDEGDYFREGDLQISLDGKTWETIHSFENPEDRSKNFPEHEAPYRFNRVQVDETQARYVRLISTNYHKYWLALNKIIVNEGMEEAKIYTNVNELGGTPVEVTSVSAISAEIGDINNITLQPSQYIGIKFTTVEQILNIQLESIQSDLVLEVSENNIEWKEVKLGDPYPNAAYVRVINKSDQAVTFDLTKLSVQLDKFVEPVVSHSYKDIRQGNLQELYEGKLGNSAIWFNEAQHVGKYVQIDMGGVVDVHNVAVVINEDEGDYFREGDLQVSLDGKTWETIHSFENPEDRSKNFPEHEAPYRFNRVQVDKIQARYVRLISTKYHKNWLALNKIIVNEGMERPGTENQAIIADPTGERGHEAFHVIDDNLSSFYTQKGEAQGGNLNYKLSQETELSKVIVLQDPEAISLAKVSVRDTESWHHIGTLSESYNSIDVSAYDHVLEVRLEWDESVKPKIYEMIPVKRGEVEMPPVDSASDLKALVEQFEQEGAFENVAAARSLKLHLTAVSHFEDQGAAEKVVRHMGGFKDLLNHQLDNALISKDAKDVLNTQADILIEKWK